ncbi:MAG: hypothetical protein IJ573_08325 [Clostridia bacterium]|nr:hypothetical protein [Clostridia bacterium]
MGQIVRKLIILPILMLVFAGIALADTDEDYEINGDLLNSIISSIDDASIVTFDMTSMDIAEGNGFIYLITQDDGGLAFHICEVTQNQLKQMYSSSEILYQNRGIPGISVETDGEVTVFYETGGGITIINTNGSWQMAGYNIVNESHETISVGFIDDQTIEVTIIDQNGEVKQRGSSPISRRISLRFEDIDIRLLPQTLSEIQQLSQ